jgi:hypothetical protein
VQVKKFKNADLAGGFSFHAEAGSGLPRTRAGRQSRIEFMLQNGSSTSAPRFATSTPPT